MPSNWNFIGVCSLPKAILQYGTIFLSGGQKKLESFIHNLKGPSLFYIIRYIREKY
jgi:hypothetical protein